MSYVHGRLNNPYPKETTFTKDQMLAIQPYHMKRWLNLRAYAVVNPEDNAIVTGCRSNLLLKAKQAISFYMPNKHVPWIDGAGRQRIVWQSHPPRWNLTAHQKGEEERMSWTRKEG